MTFDEVKAAHRGTRLVLIANDENGLSLFAATQRIDWPSDWPTAGISRDWIASTGVEFLEPANAE